jgi:hypothetical protein
MNLSPETVIVSGGKSTLTHLNFAPSFWGVLYKSDKNFQRCREEIHDKDKD